MKIHRVANPAVADPLHGVVIGVLERRCIQLLEILDRQFDPSFVLDNLRMHKGKLVKAWLGKHDRFQFHHPPVHCS